MKLPKIWVISIVCACFRTDGYSSLGINHCLEKVSIVFWKYCYFQEWVWQWVFECSPQTSSINITWEHVRNADYWANSRPANSETSGGAWESVFNEPSRWFQGRFKCETHWNRREEEETPILLFIYFFGLLFVLHICEEPVSVDCLSTCCFLLAFHSLECSNSYRWSKWTASV